MSAYRHTRVQQAACHTQLAVYHTHLAVISHMPAVLALFLNKAASFACLGVCNWCPVLAGSCTTAADRVCTSHAQAEVSHLELQQFVFKALLDEGLSVLLLQDNQHTTTHNRAQS